MSRTEIVMDCATGEVDEVTLPPLSLAEQKQALRTRIDARRDALLVADFTFNGVQYQRDAEAVKRMNGAGTLALAAIFAGALPGDLRWHGEDEDFAWIAADNSRVTMDAQTTLAFGRAAAKVESGLVMAARSLKDAVDAAADQAALDAIDIEAGWP